MGVALTQLQTKTGPMAIEMLTVFVVVLTWMLNGPLTARAENDIFQKAVNYIFTGKVEPQPAPEIVDRASCVVMIPNPKFQGYIRYYLSRFRTDTATFDKVYSGPRVTYQLDVRGDDVIIEYLSPDKKSVTQGYRSAQIPLPGDIDQTQRAFKVIFADYCKPKQSNAPF